MDVWKVLKLEHITHVKVDANYREESVSKNCNKYDPDSPILCGILAEDDKITERKVKSLKEQQLSIFDI